MCMSPQRPGRACLLALTRSVPLLTHQPAQPNDNRTAIYKRASAIIDDCDAETSYLRSTRHAASRRTSWVMLGLKFHDTEDAPAAVAASSPGCPRRASFPMGLCQDQSPGNRCCNDPARWRSLQMPAACHDEHCNRRLRRMSMLANVGFRSAFLGPGTTTSIGSPSSSTPSCNGSISPSLAQPVCTLAATKKSQASLRHAMPPCNAWR